MRPDTPIAKTPIFDAAPDSDPPARTTGKSKSSRAFVADPETEKSHEALPMTIPGSAEQAAKDVKAVSPEGEPARIDAKAGPGRIVMEIGIAGAAVLLAAAGLGVWLGWGVGLLALAVGTLALMFNPVIGAAACRAQDRAEVIHRRDH